MKVLFLSVSSLVSLETFQKCARILVFFFFLLILLHRLQFTLRSICEFFVSVHFNTDTLPKITKLRELLKILFFDSSVLTYLFGSVLGIDNISIGTRSG